MFSMRLDKETEKKLYEISEKESMSRSDVVKEALEQYIINYERKSSPYALGEDLFGNYGSGNPDDSVNYKKKVKQLINEKMSD